MMTAELQEMVQLATAAERRQIVRLGRGIHPTEHRWLVRFVFRCQYGEKYGVAGAHRFADRILQLQGVSGGDR